MSAETRNELVKLVEELLDEAEQVLDGPLENDTSLIDSGLLDSISLLQIADWVDDQMGGQLELQSTNIADEWDTIGKILLFVERGT